MASSKADMPASQREKLAKKGQAMPDKGGSGGRFPITNGDDLQRAIKAVGRAKGGEEGRRAVRRWIMRKARQLGLSSQIPDDWAADGSLKT